MEPLESLVRLGHHVQAAAARAGLTFEHYAIIPSLDGGPHRVRILIIADPTALARTPEERAEAAALDAILAATDAAEDARKKEEVRREQAADLQRNLDDGGIL